MSPKSAQKYKKLFLVVLAAAVVYIVLKYFLPLVLPFVFAYFICRLLYPWAVKLSKKTHLPLTLCSAVLVCLLTVLFAAAFAGAAWYLFSQFGKLSQSLLHSEQWMNEFLDKVCSWLSGITGDSSEAVRTLLCSLGDKLMVWLRDRLPELTAGLIVPMVKTLGTIFILIVISVVGAVLLMKNKQRITRQLKSNIFAREITMLTGRVCQVGAGFFRCQMIIIGIIAVILSAGLLLMGNSYAVLIGVTVAFLDALPVIGSGTVLLPWALFALFDRNYMSAVVLVILYILCTVVREILEPRLMGDKLGINEFYMLMATFIGIALFGVSGILLGPLGMVMILEILKQMEELL